MMKQRAVLGFAVLSAVLVLAVMGIWVMHTASMVHQTFVFTQGRNAQQNLSVALSEAAIRLHSKGVAELKTDQPSVVSARDATVDEEVSATLVESKNDPVATGSFWREGDRLVMLEAALPPPLHAKRTAVYILNPSRRSPVLLRESMR